MTRSAALGLDWLRRGLYVVAVIIVFVVLLLAAILLFQPVRESALRAAWPRIERAVPGELSIDEIRWPRLGTIEVGKLTWEVDGDSAVVCDGAEIAIDVVSLLKRDLQIEQLVAQRLVSLAGGF